MDKADILYFQIQAPNGIILIMFRDSSVTFSAKIKRKIKVLFLIFKILMLQNKRL